MQYRFPILSLCTFLSLETYTVSSPPSVPPSLPPPLPPPVSPLLSPFPSFPSLYSSWVKKFGEHNGLDVLLNILRSCSSGNYQGKDAVLRRIQHQSVRCLKAFMNNKVHWRTSNRCSIEKLRSVFPLPFSPLNLPCSSSSLSPSPSPLSIPLLSSSLSFLSLLPLLSFLPLSLPSPSSSPLLPLPLLPLPSLSSSLLLPPSLSTTVWSNKDASV